MSSKTEHNETTAASASTGDTILVRGRPNYRARIEVDSWGRLTVRPLPDQGMTTRARAIWRKAVLEIVNNAR